MKKLFGVMCLFFCVLLASCNMGLFSDRSGSIDFSIPTEDMISLTNNHAARNGDNEYSGSYIFLVQVKGNRSFYQYQIKTVTISPSQEELQNPELQLQNSADYLSKANLDFSFSRLPVGQTYTVMFDMLLSIDGNETPFSVYSGRSEGIKVSAGQSSSVDIRAMLHQQSNLLLRVDYVNGAESKQLRTPSFVKTKTMGQNDIGTEPMLLNLVKKNGKLYDGETLIKDIYYVLDSDSNFPNSAFTYSIEYFDNGHKKYNLNFKNNKCSIKNFLMNKLHNTSFSGQVAISNGRVTCNEALTMINLDSKNNLVASHSQAQTVGIMFFPKKYDAVNNKWAYVASFQLKDYIETWANTILPGDTVVIVLHDNTSLERAKNQMYYKFSSDPMDGDSIDGEILFKDNNCITHKSDETTLVIPLNFIQNPDDYLILFEDYGTEEPTEQVMNCSFTYYIFPSDMHVFAFGVGAAYNEEGQMTGDYRYEFNTSIGKMTLRQGDNVNANINGRFCTVDFSNQEYTGFTQDFYIYGELYDGGQYTPVAGEGGSESFHPLSNNEFNGNGNMKEQNISTSLLDYNGDYSFVFRSIIAPHVESGYTNDFRLLCTADCRSPDKLLLVQYFDLSFSKD